MTGCDVCGRRAVVLVRFAHDVRSYPYCARHAYRPGTSALRWHLWQIGDVVDLP